MEKYVIKRNGEYKPFEPFKIKDAIEKSFLSVSIAIDESVFDVLDKYERPKEIKFIPSFKQTATGKIIRSESLDSIKA